MLSTRRNAIAQLTKRVVLDGIVRIGQPFDVEVGSHDVEPHSHAVAVRFYDRKPHVHVMEVLENDGMDLADDVGAGSPSVFGDPHDAFVRGSVRLGRSHDIVDLQTVGFLRSHDGGEGKKARSAHSDVVGGSKNALGAHLHVVDDDRHVVGPFLHDAAGARPVAFVLAPFVAVVAREHSAWSQRKAAPIYPAGVRAPLRIAGKLRVAVGACASIERDPRGTVLGNSCESRSVPSRGALMRDDLVADIRRMLVNDLFVELTPDQIGLDDGLQRVVGLDSIGFSELRILCERKFNVEISDEDYSPDNFSSVRRLSTLIESLQARKAKS